MRATRPSAPGPLSHKGLRTRQVKRSRKSHGQPLPPAPSPKHRRGGARCMQLAFMLIPVLICAFFLNFFIASPFPNALGFLPREAGDRGGPGRGWGRKPVVSSAQGERGEPNMEHYLVIVDFREDRSSSSVLFQFCTVYLYEFIALTDKPYRPRFTSVKRAKPTYSRATPALPDDRHKRSQHDAPALRA